MHEIVRIEKSYIIVAARLLKNKIKPRVSRVGKSAVLLVYYVYVGMRLGVFVAYFGAAVGGTVVYENDPDRGVGLFEYGVDAAAQVFFYFIYRNYELYRSH